IIVLILQMAGTEESEEQVRIDSYRFNILFETVDKRNDVDLNTLIQIEWLYLPVLASYGSNQKPKRLHDELSRNPVFFIDVLKCIYKPGDETNNEEQNKGLTDKQILSRARQAYELLDSWKTIPGVDQTGNIDYDLLKSWVDEVREL